jgi:hypothetical protein
MVAGCELTLKNGILQLESRICWHDSSSIMFAGAIDKPRNSYNEKNSDNDNDNEPTNAQTPETLNNQYGTAITSLHQCVHFQIPPPILAHTAQRSTGMLCFTPAKALFLFRFA